MDRFNNDNVGKMQSRNESIIFILQVTLRPPVNLASPETGKNTLMIVAVGKECKYVHVKADQLISAKFEQRTNFYGNGRNRGFEFLYVH